MMMRKMMLLVLLCCLPLVSAQQEQDKTLSVLKTELQREYEILSQEDPAVHYMDYRVEKIDTWYCSSAMGCLRNINDASEAFFFANVKVGDEVLNNTHLVKGKQNKVQTYLIKCPPGEESDNALLQAIWNRTEQVYDDAARAYSYHKNNITAEEEKPVNDFATAEAVEYYESPSDYSLSDEQKKDIETMVQKASALFRADDNMMQGDVTFSFVTKRKYFTSSEQQNIVQNFLRTRIMIMGSIMADNGNQMSLHSVFDTFTPDQMASADVVYEATQELVDKLIALKTAVVAEPYTGPAILSPSASGVFFHEIFGHRVEGHRLKDETEGQTFKSKVGEEILPKSFSVVFDPQVDRYKDFYLNGNYKYDDEGVLGQKVTVVEDGVLKDFLMNRSPIDGFASSNGHGRADFYHGTVSRQSNMFIQNSKPLSDEKLRKALLKECKKQDLEYGYYFKKVTGGFTMTGRFTPNAFNVTPNEVYRVYVDGRPDELVRGVDLIGTPLSMFSTIVAAGTTEDIFNGMCGASSGKVPVATISPAILVSKIETQKKKQKFSTGTILPPPPSK